MTTSLTGKRAVSVAVAVPALVLLLATTRTWLTGRSAEPLLGGGVVSATGSQVAPGVVALALVCLVALVTTLTGGPVVRRASSVVLVLAAAGAVALTVAPLTDPEQALGRVAASGLGRTGVVRTTAEVSAWAWTALVAGILLFLASLLAAVAAGRLVRAVQPVRGAGRRERRAGVGRGAGADPGRERARHPPHHVGRAQRGS